MAKDINIIVDASGSMIEDGKNTVIKYLINGICSAKRNGIFGDTSFKLFQWGEETKEIYDMEKAKINFSGKSKAEELKKINELINKRDAILFISDGNIESKEKNAIKKLSNNITTIYVGIDSNKKILKDISSNKVVYSVMDFVQAIIDA